MFSKTIFKQTLKQNWKLWAIFTLIMTGLVAMITLSFDPVSLQQMQEQMAGGGRGSGMTINLLTMLSSIVYGTMGVLLSLVYVIITANSLIASQVDRGSMAYTLSTPITRTKVVCTQAIYLIMALFAMFATVTIIGLIAVAAAHGTAIDFATMDFVNLNLGIFLFAFATAGISFCASCVFNLSGKSLAFGAGIPMAFFVFEIMSGAGSDFEFLRYLSLNTLFNASAITGGGSFIIQFAVMGAIGAVLYLLGIKVFKEKDLPL
jgi:ABC-2 type transport system permease protein